MAKKPTSQTPLVPIGRISESIVEIRGRRVLLDTDLATLYGVETRALLQAVKRNASRFPDDFMFQLTDDEHKHLRSQFVISKPGRGGRRYPPYAFTEHGTIMAANTLRSERAVEVSVYVVRAFVKLREAVALHAELASKIATLERRYARHDANLKVVFDALRKLMLPPASKSRRIGFKGGKGS